MAIQRRLYKFRRRAAGFVIASFVEHNEAARAKFLQERARARPSQVSQRRRESGSVISRGILMRRGGGYRILQRGYGYNEESFLVNYGSARFRLRRGA